MSDEVLITYGRVEEHSLVWEEKWSKKGLLGGRGLPPGGGDVEYIVALVGRFS